MKSQTDSAIIIEVTTMNGKYKCIRHGFHSSTAFAFNAIFAIYNILLVMLLDIHCMTVEPRSSFSDDGVVVWMFNLSRNKKKKKNQPLTTKSKNPCFVRD